MYAFHDKPKTFTVNHFEAEGVPRSTLFYILKRKEDGISSERQSDSGRPAKIISEPYNSSSSGDGQCLVQLFFLAAIIECEATPDE